MSKKVISIVLCLALVVALAVPTLAATTLYSRINAGYRITGTATVSSSSASTTMTASEVSGTPLKPIEEYSASISLRCYATNDRLLYSNAKTGSPTLSLSYSSGTSITKVRTVHTFNGTTFGDFTVFA